MKESEQEENTTKNSKNEINSIREFIYLDRDKLISLSSQIFEGFVESYSSNKNLQQDNSEKQKGPIDSGERLGLLLSKGESQSETKSLADYAFTMLEKRLKSDGKLSTFNPRNDNHFIEITGKAIIQDISHIVNLFQNFNKIGKNIAITQIVDFQTGEMKIPEPNVTDRNQKAKAKLNNKSDKMFTEAARVMNLQIDTTAVNALNELVQFSQGETLEIIIEEGSYLFSAPLNRQFLRQELPLLVRKYGRKTEKSFTIIGKVARSGEENAEQPKISNDNIRGALLNMQEIVAEIDEQMSSLHPNEVVIDPIAIYLT